MVYPPVDGRIGQRLVGSVGLQIGIGNLGCVQALVGEGCVEGPVDARCLSEHGHEVRNGSRTRRDEIARLEIFLGHHPVVDGGAATVVRGIEGKRGQLVGNPPIARRVLHLQHPLELPAHLGEEVRQGATRLGNGPRVSLDDRPVFFPSGQQRAQRDARVDGVLAVITGVVPALLPVALARAADVIGVGIVHVASVVCEGLAVERERHRGIAAPAVETEHGRHERLTVDAFADGEADRTAHARDLEVVGAAVADRAEVGDGNALAGVDIGLGRAQRAAGRGGTVGVTHQRPLRRGGCDRRVLHPRGQVANRADPDVRVGCAGDNRPKHRGGERKHE